MGGISAQQTKRVKVDRVGRVVWFTGYFLEAIEQCRALSGERRGSQRRTSGKWSSRVSRWHSSGYPCDPWDAATGVIREQTNERKEEDNKYEAGTARAEGGGRKAGGEERDDSDGSQMLRFIRDMVRRAVSCRGGGEFPWDGAAEESTAQGMPQGPRDLRRVGISTVTSTRILPCFPPTRCAAR